MPSITNCNIHFTCYCHIYTRIFIYPPNGNICHTYHISDKHIWKMYTYTCATYKFTCISHATGSTLYIFDVYHWTNMVIIWAYRPDFFCTSILKGRSLGPVLILPNITIVVKVVFQDKLAMTKYDIVSYMRIIVQKNAVIANIQIQMICDIPVLSGKWNFHANYVHTPHMTTNNPFLNYWHFCQTTRDLLILECNHIGRSTSSNFIQKHDFQDHYINISIIFFLSRPFSCAITRVSRQWLHVCRQCVDMFWQCLDVSRCVVHDQSMSSHVHTMSQCV